MCHETLTFEWHLPERANGTNSPTETPLVWIMPFLHQVKQCIKQKGHDKPTEQMNIPKLTLVVMDTGQAGDTGKMVAKVRQGVGSKINTINNAIKVTRALKSHSSHETPPQSNWRFV